MKKTFVIEAFGSAAKTAEALGISQAAVSIWGEDLPDSAVGRISRLYPELLRLWWRESSKGEERRAGVPRRHSVGRRSSDG